MALLMPFMLGVQYGLNEIQATVYRIGCGATYQSGTQTRMLRSFSKLATCCNTVRL